MEAKDTTATVILKANFVNKADPQQSQDGFKVNALIYTTEIIQT